MLDALVQRDKLIVEARKAALVLSSQRWIEAPVQISEISSAAGSRGVSHRT